MPAPVDDSEQQISQLAGERLRACRSFRGAAADLECLVDFVQLLQHLGARRSRILPVEADACRTPPELRRARQRRQRARNTGQDRAPSGCRRT
jgi:hypothetical protein